MPSLDLTGDNAGRTRFVLKSGQSVNATNHAIFQNMATMDTFLLANGWTQARLDKISKNDKIFECRRVIGAQVNSVK